MGLREHAARHSARRGASPTTPDQQHLVHQLRAAARYARRTTSTAIRARGRGDLEPIGRKVYAIVNYDNFDDRARRRGRVRRRWCSELASATTRASRATPRARFLRIKLGEALHGAASRRTSSSQRRKRLRISTSRSPPDVVGSRSTPLHDKLVDDGFNVVDSAHQPLQRDGIGPRANTALQPDPAALTFDPDAGAGKAAIRQDRFFTRGMISLS